MLYFKHSELVNTYHVSLKTIHNWIDAAKQGKLDLELFDKNGRTYIANKPGNTAILDRLAEKGKKYRNVRFHKVITPKPYFYEIFNRRQILDIISNLTIHHEIPRQYNYFDGGANNWNDLQKKLASENRPNNLYNTIELIHSNLGAIDALLAGTKKVNIIDVGVGNAMPSRELIGHLLDRGILNRYIAIDISESMLAIAKKNVDEWFEGRVAYEGYVRDITYERFDDLVVDDMLDRDSDRIVNLVLVLGATPVNFRSFGDALKVVYGSMGSGDLLIYTGKPDTEEARRYFNFNEDPNEKILSPNYSFLLDLMNIDESQYDVEMGFDPQKRMRYVRVRLKRSITIDFKFKRVERKVHIEKGEAILLLRIWHMSALETISEFENVGFVLLQSNMTKDRGRLLTILGIDTKSEIANPS